MALFAERIRRAMKDAGLSGKRLAEDVCATGSMVTEWRRGAWPSGEYMVRLPEALGVDGHWLLTGEGEMERPDRTAKERAYDAMAAIVERTQKGEEPVPTFTTPERRDDGEEKERRAG